MAADTSTTACNRTPFLSDDECDRGTVDTHYFDDLPFCRPMEPTQPDSAITQTDFNYNTFSPPPCSCIDIDIRTTTTVTPSKKPTVDFEFKAIDDCCEGNYEVDGTIDFSCILFTVTSDSAKVDIDTYCCLPGDDCKATGSFNLNPSIVDCALVFKPELDLKIPRSPTYDMDTKFNLEDVCEGDASGHFKIVKGGNECDRKYTFDLDLHVPKAPKINFDFKATTETTGCGKISSSTKVKNILNTEECTRDIGAELNLKIPCMPFTVSGNSHFALTEGYCNTPAYGKFTFDVQQNCNDCSIILKPSLDLTIPKPKSVDADIRLILTSLCDSEASGKAYMLKSGDECDRTYTSVIELNIPKQRKVDFDLDMKMTTGGCGKPSGYAYVLEEGTECDKKFTGMIGLTIPCMSFTASGKSTLKITEKECIYSPTGSFRLNLEQNCNSCELKLNPELTLELPKQRSTEVDVKLNLRTPCCGYIEGDAWMVEAGTRCDRKYKTVIDLTIPKMAFSTHGQGKLKINQISCSQTPFGSFILNFDQDCGACALNLNPEIELYIPKPPTVDMDLELKLDVVNCNTTPRGYAYVTNLGDKCDKKFKGVIGLTLPKPKLFKLSSDFKFQSPCCGSTTGSSYIKRSGDGCDDEYTIVTDIVVPKMAFSTSGYATLNLTTIDCDETPTGTFDLNFEQDCSSCALNLKPVLKLNLPKPKKFDMSMQFNMDTPCCGTPSGKAYIEKSGTNCDRNYKTVIDLTIPKMAFSTSGTGKLNVKQVNCDATPSGTFNLNFVQDCGACTLKLDPEINLNIPKNRNVKMDLQMDFTLGDCDDTPFADAYVDEYGDGCDKTYKGFIDLIIPKPKKFTIDTDFQFSSPCCGDIDADFYLKEAGSACDKNYTLVSRLTIPRMAFSVHGEGKLNVNQINCDATPSGTFNLNFKQDCGGCALDLKPVINLNLPKPKSSKMDLQMNFKADDCNATPTGSAYVEISGDDCDKTYKGIINLTVPKPRKVTFDLNLTVDTKGCTSSAWGSFEPYPDSGGCDQKLGGDMYLYLPCPFDQQEAKISGKVTYGEPSESTPQTYLQTHCGDGCSLWAEDIDLDLKIKCPFEAGNMDLTIKLDWDNPKEDTKTLAETDSECKFTMDNPTFELGLPCPKFKVTADDDPTIFVDEDDGSDKCGKTYKIYQKDDGPQTFDAVTKVSCSSSGGLDVETTTYTVDFIKHTITSSKKDGGDSPEAHMVARDLLIATINAIRNDPNILSIIDDPNSEMARRSFKKLGLDNPVDIDSIIL